MPTVVGGRPLQPLPVHRFLFTDNDLNNPYSKAEILSSFSR